jgi:hypothetical protein
MYGPLEPHTNSIALTIQELTPGVDIVNFADMLRPQCYPELESCDAQASKLHQLRQRIGERPLPGRQESST